MGIFGNDIPPDQMSRPELEEMVVSLRNLFSWLDEDQQFWLSKVNSTVRVVTRQAKGYVGLWRPPTVIPKDLRLEVVKREYDLLTNKQYIEGGLMVIPISGVAQMEFLDTREEFQDIPSDISFGDDGRASEDGLPLASYFESEGA